MLLKPSPVSTSRFTARTLGDTCLLSADASDLGRDFRLGRVWDDACDVGFTLVSHVTGAEEPVVFVRSFYDEAEGEKLYDLFEGVNRPVKVRLYND